LNNVNAAFFYAIQAYSDQRLSSSKKELNEKPWK